MAILGQFAAFTNNSTQSVHSTRYHHTPATRQRAYMTVWQSGRRVCKKTFLFLHTIFEKRFRNLQKSFRENGLTPRCHGNTRRLPANTIAFTDTQRVVEFLHTYAEANAILLLHRCAVVALQHYKETGVAAVLYLPSRPQYHSPSSCLLHFLLHLATCGASDHGHQTKSINLRSKNQQ